MRDEVLDVGKNNEAKLRANAKYNKKTYEKISFDSRKEYRLNELINFAAQKKRKLARLSMSKMLFNPNLLTTELQLTCSLQMESMFFPSLNPKGQRNIPFI